MSDFLKPTLKSILIFGASGHIGKPLAEFLSRKRPDIKLRLATSAPEKKESLQKAFASAEIVVADFYDLPTLTKAVEGIDGAFVVTPSGTAEREPMENLVTAFKKWGTVIHIVRLVGVFPEFNPHRVPDTLKGGRSLPVQHPIAKAILDESGLPVTYINSGATFVDNMFLQIKSVQLEKKFIWPEHRVPFIDPRDIAEVAGKLLLSDNAKHIGQFHTMNNGTDWLEFREVAEIVSDVLGRPIPYDGSKESFFRFYGPFLGENTATTMWNFFKFEQANEVCWALNNFVERTIDRKPKTVREWLLEHRQALLAGL
ncbi:hypothetical protein BKA64DRAFT_665672 [Cadophora sp. MPI-SDFR-AT-0126]|nr:hypothetical protein BKA64DRAFT_665672 [Leotiomycetes sp. MPI-SDFR-AT-0126]